MYTLGFTNNKLIVTNMFKLNSFLHDYQLQLQVQLVFLLKDHFHIDVHLVEFYHVVLAKY